MVVSLYDAVMYGRLSRKASSAAGTTYTAPTRLTATYTTASLAADAAENGNLTLAPGYRLYAIETNYPCWFRCYVDTGTRTTDSTRLITDDPEPGSAPVYGFIATDTFLAAYLYPITEGYTDDGTSTVPIRIVNKDTVSRAVTVTLTYIKTEV